MLGTLEVIFAVSSESGQVNKRGISATEGLHKNSACLPFQLPQYSILSTFFRDTAGDESRCH